MITSRTFNTTPGATQLMHPSLYGVSLLCVKREGIEYDKISPLSTPSGLQYYNSAHRLVFDPLVPFNVGEKIFVLYES